MQSPPCSLRTVTWPLSDRSMVAKSSFLVPLWSGLMHLLPVHDSTQSVLLRETGHYETPQTLTEGRRWSSFARDLAAGNPALDPSVTLTFLHEAPKSAISGLQTALRQRLMHDEREGLRLLDPAHRSSFGGREVCDGGSLRWKRVMASRLAQDHDLETAFQRQDCTEALSGKAP